MNDFTKIKEICDRWLFPKHKINSDETLDSLYFKAKGIDFTPLIKAFTSRLDTIPCKFSKSEQVSGSICFFGGVFTSLLNYGHIEEIEGLFTFALCYMLIDHFLDDDTINYEEKTKSMQEIYLFISIGQRSENKLINAAAERYLELIEKVPKCRDYFIKLFKSELRGVEIQRNKNLDREVYLQIAEEKGGLTASVIGSIIGLEDDFSSKMLGELIQLVDDILDVGDDSTLNIYTLARYDLDNGNMDEYVTYTIKQVEKLSNVYNFFKPILLLGIILGLQDNPGNISEELNDILQYYNPFLENTSKDTLCNWFHHRLYEYIDLTKN